MWVERGDVCRPLQGRVMQDKQLPVLTERVITITSDAQGKLIRKLILTEDFNEMIDDLIVTGK